MKTPKKQPLANNEDTEKGIPKPPKKIIEISPEAKEDRLLITGLLTERADELAKQAASRKKKINDTPIEFHSGVKISLAGIASLVSAIFQPCDSLFPNSVSFFSEMYRLLHWTDKDPNSYFKDPIVGYYINELIYRRFPPDVILALRALAVPGGIRLTKFYHYLKPDGQRDVVKFRNEAIKMMKEHSNWADFRKAYTNEYHVPYYSQPPLF